MRNRMTAVLCIALMSLLPALSGKEAKDAPKDLDLTQRYFVTECLHFRHCIEKVLNPAGAAGYRFVAGDIWEVDDDEGGKTTYILVVMERTGDGKTTYQYIESPRTDEGLNQAASRGFRLVPRFPLEPGRSRKPLLTLGGGGERLISLMEKPSYSDFRFQYLAFGASKSWPKSGKAASLFDEMEAARAKGFEVVQFTKTAPGYAVVLEKALGGNPEPVPNGEDSPGSPSLPRYRLLSTWKTSTLREELAAAAGYRLAAADVDYRELLLERTPQISPGYEYMLISRPLEESINAAAAMGFRLNPCSRGVDFTLMEMPPGSKALYEYRVIVTTRLSTMRKELADAVKTGFAVAMVVYQDWAVKALVLERLRESGKP